MYVSTSIALLIAALAIAVSASPLLESRASCSTPDGAGTCLSTSSCSGFHVAGYCPGASDIQCCISKSCSTASGSGICKNTASSCSGGSFISGACPGDSSIQCCVKGTAGGGSGSGTPAISEAGVQLIESEEGFRSNFYYIDGDKTIAYGHDCTKKGDCASITAPISKAQGEALLKKDLVGYESCVCKLPNASGLNQNQYGALVSFAYNSGCGGVSHYWTSAMRKKDYKGICKALPTTNTLGGELSGRRKREGDFCSKPTNTPSGC